MTLLMRDDMLQIASLADCHVSKHAHASKAAAAGLRANARARGAGRVLTSAALPLIRAWCSLPLLPLPLTFACPWRSLSAMIHPHALVLDTSPLLASFSYLLHILVRALADARRHAHARSCFSTHRQAVSAGK